jgi:hypothetical protein
MSKLQKVGLIINAGRRLASRVGDPTSAHIAHEVKFRATVRLVAQNENLKQIPLLISESELIFH